MRSKRNASDRRLAASSWSWHEDYYAGRWSLLDLPAAAREAGLAYIECNDFMLPPPRLSRLRQPLLRLLPGAPPELWRYSRATLDRLAARARDASVTVLAWTVNSDFSAPAWAWPAQRLYLLRGLDAAVRLSATLLRVTLGERDAVSDEQAVWRLAAFVQASQRRAPDLAITVENHWGISADIDRHLRIVRQAARRLDPAARDGLGCCFDPGNTPRDEVPQGTVERWWRELASEANHFHFKTTAFDAEGKDTALPHARILSMLAEAGYEGDAAIEYQGQGDAVAAMRQSVALFKRLWGSETS